MWALGLTSPLSSTHESTLKLFFSKWGQQRNKPTNEATIEAEDTTLESWDLCKSSTSLALDWKCLGVGTWRSGLWSVHNRRHFLDLVRKAGGKVIFIYCQACVSLGMKGHCCLLWHLFHISLPHSLDAPSKFFCIFGKAFNEDSVSSHNWMQPGAWIAQPLQGRQQLSNSWISKKFPHFAPFFRESKKCQSCWNYLCLCDVRECTGSSLK